MNYTDEQLQKAFDNQPETLQDYIMGDEVALALHTLAEWFELNDIDMFSRAVLALLVGLLTGDDFIKFIEENFGLANEDAENLFGEVGDRIMVKAYEIYDQALKDAGIKATPISITENETPSQTTPTPVAVSQQAPTPRPTIDIRKFVGIPAYGVEKPASSYTSILPHSDTEVNKAKDTPTADSFIQKLNNLNAIPLKKLTTTPVPKKEISPIELSKLAGPVNIPRQEIKMPQNLVTQTTPTLPVMSKTPTQPTPSISSTQSVPTQPSTPSTPPPSKLYSVGTDPYREPPTP